MRVSENIWDCGSVRLATCVCRVTTNLARSRPKGNTHTKKERRREEKELKERKEGSHSKRKFYLKIWIKKSCFDASASVSVGTLARAVVAQWYTVSLVTPPAN